MTDHVIQGVACEFDKPFFHGDEVWILKSGCFDNSLREFDVDLLMNHDPDHRLGTPMISCGREIASVSVPA